MLAPVPHDLFPFEFIDVLRYIQHRFETGPFFLEPNPDVGDILFGVFRKRQNISSRQISTRVINLYIERSVVGSQVGQIPLYIKFIY